jgi:hypothetical protein
MIDMMPEIARLSLTRLRNRARFILGKGGAMEVGDLSILGTL